MAMLDTKDMLMSRIDRTSWFHRTYSLIERIDDEVSIIAYVESHALGSIGFQWFTEDILEEKWLLNCH